MHASTRDRPRILIVYQYIALYRLPIFAELTKSELFQFEILSGTEGSGETPQLAKREQLQSAPFVWIEAENNWIARNYLWQHPLLSMVLRRRYDGFIFLGDPHYLSTWAAALAARINRIPVFFWTIGMHRPESGIRLFLRNLWHRIPNQLLIYGEYAKQLMIAAGVSPQRITVIGNSLDFEEQSRIFETVAATPPPRTSVPVLIAIGRITARRKLERLIEAVALLKVRGVQVRARIIGDGPARQALELLANQMGIEESIEFLGAIYDETVIARHMYAAELCVVPGIIGLGAIHAQSYGTPVITCGNWTIQAPEAEVIVPGETGGFCKWDDADSVADSVQNWLSVNRDREQVRINCRAAVAEKWTPARQRALIEAAIQSFLISA